jgi:uncharacterized protein YndB with AHSA1/START domain
MQKTITIEKIYPHSPEDVWNSLTSPELMSEWLMKNNFEARPGHTFQFTYEMDGKQGTVDCKVLEVSRPRKLSYTWQWGPAVTVVTWLLEPAAGGTRLRLEHSGFDSEKDAEIFQKLSGGWQKKLDEQLPESIGKHVAAAV